MGKPSVASDGVAGSTGEATTAGGEAGGGAGRGVAGGAGVGCVVPRGNGCGVCAVADITKIDQTVTVRHCRRISAL